MKATSTRSGLLDKYPIDAYDPNKTAEIMQSKGYAKTRDGFWTKDGKALEFTLINAPGFFELRPCHRGSSCARPASTPLSRIPTDAATLKRRAMSTSSSTVIRPRCATLPDHDPVHSRYNAPIGAGRAVSLPLEEYGLRQIIDEMATVAPGTPTVHGPLAPGHGDLDPQPPSIPTVQWYQICPDNDQLLEGLAELRQSVHRHRPSGTVARRRSSSRRSNRPEAGW